MKLSDVRLAALFLVSACVLAFEMEVMRVFAVTSWSNFGSMVISIALLGFGFAGTLLTLLGRRVSAHPDGWLAWSAFALAPAMAAAHVLAQLVPFNPVLIASDPSQLLWIGVYYLVYFPPFFAAGIFIGTAFTVLSSRTHGLYLWNMVGSGAGGLLVLGLMYIFPPEHLIYPLVGAAALPALICCIDWLPPLGRFRVRGMEAGLCLLLAGMSFLLVVGYGSLKVSDFKPVSYARKFPDAVRVYESSSPRGQMQVYASSYFHFAPGLSDNASLSPARTPRDAFLGLYTDGDGPVGIMRKLTPAEEGYIDYLPMSAPYLLLAEPKVLVLKLGGTAGVHTALHNGAREVRVVESNPDLIRMIRDVPAFRTFTGGILTDERVKVVNAEVRAFAGSTPERFDLVEIGLIDSYGLSQAGGYTVEENYVYTAEAISEYLNCLAPSGILSITVWDRLTPPRNVPRLLSTVVEALRRQDVLHPERRLYAFNLLLSTATVLVKNGDFSPAEIALLNGFCKRMSFESVYYPGMKERKKSFDDILDGYAATFADPGKPAARAQEKADVDLRPGDLYHFSLEWMLGGRQEELFSRYVFDIRPATDDKPYYAGYLKPGSIPQAAGHLGELSEEWGYLLLLGTLAQSILFGLLIVLLPLLFRGRALFTGKRGTVRIVLYYACLGLGYMMAEIFLIQRFVMFLSDPVYSNSIIITALLVASGLGSLLSGRLKVPRQALVMGAVAGIAALAIFFHFGLPPVLRSLLGLPLALRSLLSALLVAPIGLLLGVPFPAGLSALSQTRGEILPWAWGVNGAVSVAGSVLTRVVSTTAGFSAVLLCVAALYLSAGFLFGGNQAHER